MASATGKGKYPISLSRFRPRPPTSSDNRPWPIPAGFHLHNRSRAWAQPVRDRRRASSGEDVRRRVPVHTRSTGRRARSVGPPAGRRRRELHPGTTPPTRPPGQDDHPDQDRHPISTRHPRMVISILQSCYGLASDLPRRPGAVAPTKRGKRPRNHWSAVSGLSPAGFHATSIEWEGQAADGAVLVAVHGLTAWSRLRRVARESSGQFRVVLPGRGRRGKSDWACRRRQLSYPQYLADSAACWRVWR